PRPDPAFQAGRGGKPLPAVVCCAARSLPFNFRLVTQKAHRARDLFIEPTPDLRQTPAITATADPTLGLARIATPADDASRSLCAALESDDAVSCISRNRPFAGNALGHYGGAFLALLGGLALLHDERLLGEQGEVLGQ